MKKLKLSNGVMMPVQMMGTSVWDRKGSVRVLFEKMSRSVRHCVTNQLAGLDTGRDYNNEEQLGAIFQDILKNGVCKREDIFITTKVGNGQQRNKNMNDEINKSLCNFKLDFVDLWLLHWPLPEYWIDNWAQMCEIQKSGKIRAIGIANCRERHIETIMKEGLQMPHVIQVEHHPFRTTEELLELCSKHHIQVEAYSSNCLMLPFVKNNDVLNKIALNHNKTVAQVIMRWHIQHGVIPIFSSFSIEHINDNVNVFDFELSKEEMKNIFNLNNDYKFHPESLNCPGY